MSKFAYKHKTVSHVGHNVSHAKNRTKRKFKYNLQTCTLVIDGKKQKVRIPAKLLKTYKKKGLTTHYKKPQAK